MKTLKSTKEYNIGWIAALPIERAAAIALFDEEHTQPLDFAQHHSDKNSYSWGRVSNHNVVVAALPAIYGITPATVAALGLVATFPHIKIGLLVGIGAGLPTPSLDIRIGDIAVSQPSGTSGGVIQYDTGKATPKGWERTGVSTLPPLILLSALGNVQARHELEDSRVQELLQDAARRNRKFSENYMRPILEDDRLSKSYSYVNWWEMELKRPCRTDKAPRIFYGNIASGNVLVKDETTREKILESIGEPCICFEMEAAGLMSSFPCLVIRGISDYADSRKDDHWQRYAAAVAAAFAKELLYYVPKFEIESIKSIAELLGDMQSISNKLHESVQTTGKNLLTMDMERWLAAADPSHDYHQALKVRHAGSGEWFLSSSIFQEWQNKTFSVLLLYGIPGCGKTVLASTIIEHLQRIGDDTEFLLYFYLDVQDRRKQNLDDILRSLIRQMLYMVPSGVTHLEQAYKSYCLRNLDTTELNGLFLTLCEQNSVVIVLDALDECTEPENLFDWIKNISAIDHVRLILSARIHEDIGKLLRDWLSPNASLVLGEELIDADIKAFIHSSIHNPQGKFSRWATRPDIKQRIEMHLTENAGGMFRWAVCQLDALSRCVDPISLEATLNTLPKGLYETYDRILQNIPSELRDHAVRILQFLVYSHRAPLIEELVDAVIVRPDLDPAFDECNRLPVPQEIAVICTSLIQIVSRDITELEIWQIFGDSKGAQSKQLAITEVRLAHTSVKDYLLTSRPGNIFSNELGEFEAKRLVVEVSLAYIYEAWRRSQEDLNDEMPLIRYASQCWWNYARYAEKAGGDALIQIQRLFSNADFFNYWLSNYNLEYQSGYSKEGSALYYASLGGLTTSVESLLHKDMDVNDPDMNDRRGALDNALTAASASGYIDIVKLLLDRGALVDGALARNGTRAYSAAIWRQEELIRRLRPECPTTNHESSSLTVFKILHTAIRTGNKKSVETLLRHGSTFKAMGIKFEDVMEAARDLRLDDPYFDKMYKQQVARTYIPPKTFDANIARLFVKPDIKINTESFLVGNALVVACRGNTREHVEVVELLLKSGAHVFDYGGGIGTILQAAAYLGHLEIVELLLDHGADINSSNEFMSDWTFHTGTALQHASGRGHIEVAKILLNRGADINKESSPDSPVFEDRNAIDAAIRAGNFMIVRLLLKHNANLDESVLQLALECGHDGIIKLLNDSTVNTCVHTPSMLLGGSMEVDR